MNLRALAKDRHCLVRIPGVCNGRPETVVLAHFRLSGVSGLGLKSPDLLGAWACSDCHRYVDTHHDDATKRAFLEGVVRTQAKLIEQGVVKW